MCFRFLVPFFATVFNLSALTIEIDYTYDTNHFFGLENNEGKVEAEFQERREAIEAVAKFYGDLIQDNLKRVDRSDFANPTGGTNAWAIQFFNPSSTNSIQIQNPVIPEDTIIVYVGSRNLPNGQAGLGGPGGLGAGGSSEWLDRAIGRGQDGAQFRNAQAHLRTDIGLWGGQITFNRSLNWNFSLEQNQGGIEFLTAALHEMGHVLGLGTSDPWTNLLTSSGNNFTGSAATASFGSPPPVNGTHFTDEIDSPLYGSFGAPHGSSRPALMLPSTTDNGKAFDVITDLDLAALVDLGWEIAIPMPAPIVNASPSEATLTFPSTSFCSYEVLKSTELLSFNQSGSTIVGDGFMHTWSDPSLNPSSAYYKLVSNPHPFLSQQSSFATAPSPAKAKSSSSQSKNSETSETIEVAPNVATDCFCNGHDEHDH